jgi:HAD superfamily hydrolase (TIGR01509 family)
MANHTPIRAVIFDMDGVLVDSEKLINDAAIAMFREQGLIVQPDDFLPFVGAGEDRYIGGVAERYGFPLDGPAAKKRTYEIYLELAPSQLEVFPGTLDLLHACRRAGLLLAVASSADEIKVRANLQTIGLPLDFWDAVVKGEDALRKKPSPDAFLFAAQKLGVMPSECVVVEDAINGVQAARAAGMRCVAVATSFPPDRLHEADVVRDSIAEVSLSDLASHLGKS